MDFVNLKRVKNFSPAVIGADDAGAQKVNKIAAQHYTFDQHALGTDGINESTGEIWVATDGNYIVKYVLVTKGDEKNFGPGVSGTLTVDYELTGPNTPVEITLPDDCPPGFVTVGMMPDAQDVQNLSGSQTYTTGSTISNVMAFYENELPDLGWTTLAPAAIDENGGFEAFS